MNLTPDLTILWY